LAPRTIARRALLLGLSGVLPATNILRAQSGKGTNLSLKPLHFLDPATEFDLYRLTDPAKTSVLPAPNLHCISRRGRFLVHGSDHSGATQAWRLDWHTGEARQLTAAVQLDASTIAMTNDDHTLFFFDGPSLRRMTMPGLREREAAHVDAGWQRAPGFSVALDGSAAAWVEKRENQSRLRVLRSANGAAETLVEAGGILSDPQLRPGHTQISYRAGNEVRLADLNSPGSHAIQLAPDASVGQVLWSPAGQTLLYLSTPADPKQLTALREYSPDDATDKLVAKTSQFASFGINADASVFVGASRSLASPYVLLLLRVARRELTLCEHRSSNPVSVAPVFSPDSQNIFFTSDRNGKPALYRLHVEKFVEETDDEQPG
jgi:oligogalacturonide lyase